MIVPSVGSSKPPIMRSVVVLPQPDGPSIAKKLPRSILRLRRSTATTSSKRFVTSTSVMSAAPSRPVGASSRRRSSTAIRAHLLGALRLGADHVGAPVVELLPQVEVEEGLRREHGLEAADAVRD